MASVAKIPAELKSVLAKNKRAHDAFQKLPPSHRKEYIAWISEAKKAETRETRAAKCLDMLLSAK